MILIIFIFNAQRNLQPPGQRVALTEILSRYDAELSATDTIQMLSKFRTWWRFRRALRQHGRLPSYSDRGEYDVVVVFREALLLGVVPLPPVPDHRRENLNTSLALLHNPAHLLPCAESCNAWRLAAAAQWQGCLITIAPQPYSKIVSPSSWRLASSCLFSGRATDKIRMPLSVANDTSSRHLV